MSTQEFITKKVLLKNTSGEYLIPYTNESEKKSVWGNISGSLEDQTDLSTALSNKADSSSTYTKTEVDGLVENGLRYKGEASSYAALPTTGNVVADVWRVLTACESPAIPANGYVLWEGDKWGVISFDDTEIFNTINSLESKSITVWESTKTYSIGKTCYKLTTSSLNLYISLTDNNTGNNPSTSTGNWKKVEMGGGGTSSAFDWIGTSAEYTAAYEAGDIEADWVCLVTDDDLGMAVSSEYDTSSPRAVNSAAVASALRSFINDNEEEASESTVFSSAKVMALVRSLEALINGTGE